VGAIARQDDLVGDHFDKMTQEVAGCSPFGLAMKFDIGKFARSIDGNEHVKLTLGGLHLRDIDAEEADRVALEFGLGRLVALNLGQAADAMALQTAMQR